MNIPQKFKGKAEIFNRERGLSLSLCAPLFICGYLHLVVFLLHFYHIFGNKSLFLRKHIFVDFNEFSSLMC